MRTNLLNKSCMTLCAGVSLAVLAIAAPAQAADFKVKAAAADRGEFRAFVEGGAFWTGGDPVPYTAPGFRDVSFGDFFGGLIPFIGILDIPTLGGDASVKPKIGWDAAVGADYRFAGTPWHVNVQARGGQSKGSDDLQSSFSNSISFALLNPGNGSASLSSSGLANTSVGLTETRWQADFGMGYDFIPRLMQINFGFRVAEVTAETTAASTASATQLVAVDIPGQFTASASGTGSASDTTTTRRSFFGAGPRAGLEGSVPIIGAMAFDFSGNAALLFGNTKITTESNSGSASAFNATITGLGGGGGALNFSSATSQSGLLNRTHWSSQIVVYNFDIQAGFSYWFTPNLKLGVSYRLDAFLDALRATPDDGVAGVVGPGRSIDRFYHGPKIALTGKIN